MPEFSLGGVAMPVDQSMEIDNSPIYTQNDGTAFMVDIPRTIQWSDGYYYLYKVSPVDGKDILLPGATYEDQIVVTPGCIITQISATAVDPVTGVKTIGPGFKFQIHDVGAKCDIFMRTWPNAYVVAGDMPQVGPNVPIGPHFLTSPLFILEPGQITVQITSLDLVNSLRINVLLEMAIPINAQSLEKVWVKQ